MKKLKLKLKDLQVQSFVTEFNKKDGETKDVKGGWPTAVDYCSGTGSCFSDPGKPCGFETIDLCYSNPGQYCG